MWFIAGIINSSSASYFIASIVNSSVSLQLPPSASSGSYRINRTKSPDWLHKKPWAALSSCPTLLSDIYCAFLFCCFFMFYIFVQSNHARTSILQLLFFCTLTFISTGTLSLDSVFRLCTCFLDYFLLCNFWSVEHLCLSLYMYFFAVDLRRTF